MMPYNQESDIGFLLDIQNSLFTYSDSEGLIRLYFEYTYASQATTFLYNNYYFFFCEIVLNKQISKIQISIDGISVISREVKFSYSSEKQSVGYLKLLQIVPQKSNYVG